MSGRRRGRHEPPGVTVTGARHRRGGSDGAGYAVRTLRRDLWSHPVPTVPSDQATTDTADRRPLRSYLKWVGGKTRTAPILRELAPTDGYRTYLEPFCGSAAMFFALRPDAAVVSDANEDLVVAHQQVADHPHEVMDQLDRWPNTKQHFLRVRSWDGATLDPVVRAARVVYLNKTAFRGLWRVNRRGGFNTPYGRYDRPYYNRDTFLAASVALREADIVHGDAADVLHAKASRGDWVYLDPPYVPDRTWGDFDRYTTRRFGGTAQVDLTDLLRDLDDAGVRWLLTNSDTDTTRALYADWHLAVLPTRRDVALDASTRASVDLVVSNYDLPHHDALHPA